MTAVSYRLTDHHVAILTLNRPEARNAFSEQMALELRAAVERAQTDAARAAVLDAEGAAFCVGGDIRVFEDVVRTGRLLDRVSNDMLAFNPAVVALAELGCPTVAAVHGAVAGGGLALATACDLRVCGRPTVFAPGFAGIGMPPDTGTSWFLPRLIGAGRAAEFLLTNRRISEDEALSIGLVNEISEDPRRRAVALAEGLAAGPRSALADTKALIAASLGRNLVDQMAAEAVAVIRALHGRELAEGILAFAEKREPRFSDVGAEDRDG